MSKNKNIQRALRVSASESLAPVVPASEPVATEHPTFLVKKGKAVVGKRGVIGEGKEIKISDVNTGIEGLRVLYEKGYVEVVE